MTPIDFPEKGFAAPVAPVEKVDPATLSKFQQLCLKSQPLMLYVVSLAQFLDIGMFSFHFTSHFVLNSAFVPLSFVNNNEQNERRMFPLDLSAALPHAQITTCRSNTAFPSSILYRFILPLITF